MAKDENKGNAVKCSDVKCALHGSLKVRGNLFTGKVVSAKAEKTVVVEREIMHFVHKYERYKKTVSRIAAYNPKCIDAKENDIVKIGETRRLSKTKSFVVLEKIGHAKDIRREEAFFGGSKGEKESAEEAVEEKESEREVDEK
ncbi:MAG: 30S ribosomal protein S17 [Candidatus Diapherotrites archaeon]